MFTTAQGSATRALVPPEERFWQRYSPRSEAPVSGVTSTVIHILILLLILGVAWVQNLIKPDEQTRPPPIVAVRLKEGVPGPQGPGKDGPPGASDLGPDTPRPGGTDPRLPSDHPDLKPAPTAKVPETNKDRPIRPQPSGEEVQGILEGVSKAARKKIGGSLLPGPGAGTKDKGPSSGGDEGTINTTLQRLNRWTLIFNTRSDRDYLDQLIGLGAILAIPIDEDKARFLVIRDLNNPKSGKEADLSGLNRIFWIDDKAESLRSLFTALEMRKPRYFVALFPRDLETKMRRMEEDYTRQNFNDISEANIEATTFEVIIGPAVRLRSVTMKKR